MRQHRRAYLRKLLTQQGFGMIEVLMASALLGALSVAVMRMSNTAMNAAKVVEGKYDLNTFNQSVRFTLSKSAGCGNTFITPVANIAAATTITQIEDANGTVRYSVGDRVMNTWEISSMELSAWTEDTSNPGTGEANLRINLQRTGNVKLGVAQKFVDVSIFIRKAIATPTIDTCITATATTDSNGVWMTNFSGGGEYIYYNGSPLGYVGIGPDTTPDAPLAFSKTGDSLNKATMNQTVLLESGMGLVWDTNGAPTVDAEIGIGVHPTEANMGTVPYMSIFADGFNPTPATNYNSLLDIGQNGNIRTGDSNNLTGAGGNNVVLGLSNVVAGNSSMVFGFNNQVDGTNYVMGGTNQATGIGGVILGAGNATSVTGVAIGFNNTVSGGTSVAIGRNGNVSGVNSLVLGNAVLAADNSFASSFANGLSWSTSAGTMSFVTSELTVPDLEVTSTALVGETACIGTTAVGGGCTAPDSLCMHSTGCSSGSNKIHLGTPMTTNLYLAGTQPILRGSGSVIVESAGGGSVEIGTPSSALHVQPGNVEVIFGNFTLSQNDMRVTGANNDIVLSGANNAIEFFGGSSMAGAGGNTVRLSGNFEATNNIAALADMTVGNTLSAPNISATNITNTNFLGVDGEFTGTLVVGGVTVTSDRYVKTPSEQELSDEEILDSIMGLTIEKWQYNRDIDNGKEVYHIGPYAQDFQREFGLSDQDTKINLLDMAGVNMRAIQAVIRKQERLEKELFRVLHRNQKMRERSLASYNENKRLKKVEEENEVLKKKNQELEARIIALEKKFKLLEQRQQSQ